MKTISKHALIEQNTQLTVQVNELKVKIRELTTTKLLGELDAIDPLIINRETDHDN